MRVRAAIAIAILVAVLLAGCGASSTSTGVTKRAASGPEEGLFEVGGPGPPPAEGGVPPLRGARLRIAEARHVEEGEMVAGDEGWVRSDVGVFWTPDGGRTWRPITPPVPDGGAIDTVTSPARGAAGRSTKTAGKATRTRPCT